MATRKQGRLGAFQLTAARRRLHRKLTRCAGSSRFQLTAARRRLPRPRTHSTRQQKVSTHSRSKAAASASAVTASASPVSTHSRSKAAAGLFITDDEQFVFQLTAARRRLHHAPFHHDSVNYGFNSQPLEGGCKASLVDIYANYRFNSQPLEGGCLLFVITP